MRLLIIILGFLNGGFMLADGIYVVLNRKYIGSEKPGPWAELFYKLDIDVFKLGPLFIVFGLLWLTWVYAVWKKLPWAYLFGILISIFTLWYLSIGTMIAGIILLVLLVARRKTGL